MPMEFNDNELQVIDTVLKEHNHTDAIAIRNRIANWFDGAPGFNPAQKDSGVHILDELAHEPTEAEELQHRVSYMERQISALQSRCDAHIPATNKRVGILTDKVNKIDDGGAQARLLTDVNRRLCRIEDWKRS